MQDKLFHLYKICKAKRIINKSLILGLVMHTKRFWNQVTNTKQVLVRNHILLWKKDPRLLFLILKHSMTSVVIYASKQYYYATTFLITLSLWKLCYRNIGKLSHNHFKKVKKRLSALSTISRKHVARGHSSWHSPIYRCQRWMGMN